MEAEITCELCGGTDFYKDAGFYYCNDCQTQTQEMQEHVFEVPTQEDDLHIVKNAKKGNKSKSSSDKNRDPLTTWECYNYIIFGLVEELIELGAKPQLKNIVKTLWFRYLKKLEVINDDPLEPPKLPAYNFDGNAEVIYGRIPRGKLARKRVRRNSGSTDLSSTSNSSRRIIKGKRRRAMAEAEYTDISSAKQSDVSLLNQSLQSLQSSSEQTHIQETKHLKFSKEAESSLREIMTEEHLNSHKEDADTVLHCHKLTKRLLSWRYFKSAAVLTRSKIYGILYLGLLITKDKIQLGTMLRFIREGHMSYHNIDHFYPEQLENCDFKLNKNAYSSNVRPTHSGMRQYTIKMAKYLEVTEEIPIQNLVLLTGQYCAELNLPVEIKNYVLKILSRTKPDMKINLEKPEIFPNYEGRVASFILFTLKLLFGLDDATEYHLSKTAQSLNENSPTNKRHFDFIRWRNFLEYQKVIIAQHHFPTSHVVGGPCSSSTELYSDFLGKLGDRHERDDETDKRLHNIEHLLEKLNLRTKSVNYTPKFPITLTPNLDYLDFILDSNLDCNSEYLIDNFTGDSIEFLVHTKAVLPGKVVIEHQGANENLELVNVLIGSGTKITLKRWNCVEIVEKVKTPNTKNVKKDFRNRVVEYSPLGDSKLVSCLFTEIYSDRFKKNKKYYKKCSNKSRVSKEDTVKNCDKYSSEFVHYNPDEKFWLNSTNVPCWTNSDEFEQYLSSLPFNFRLVLTELARITEQTVKEMLEEYVTVEMYLCYCYDFASESVVDVRLNKGRQDKKMNLIKHAKRIW